jgi:hypothetical protein
LLEHQRVISRDQRQGRARIAGFGGTQQQFRRRDIAVVQIGLAALERLAKLVTVEADCASPRSALLRRHAYLHS